MKKKRLTRGENFLPGIGVDRLKALRKKEIDIKTRDMPLAHICGREDRSIREIGKVFGQACFIIRDWPVRADQTGLERLYDMSKPGLPRRLSPKQLADFREDLTAGSQKHGF